MCVYDPVFWAVSHEEIIGIIRREFYFQESFFIENILEFAFIFWDVE